MMYLCRMVHPEGGLYYGEGLSPELAYKDAESICDYAVKYCEITFWEMEKTKIKVSFDPVFSD